MQTVLQKTYRLIPGLTRTSGKDRKKLEPTLTMVNYSFQVNKLGWVNIDKFYNAPYAIASNVLIKLKGQEVLDYAQVGFKNVNSYMSLQSGR
ncbi:MAG: hypothetical protein K2X86_00875 [Cytophagaceae bacterium]|nr:hypothetical protein [Cytophagaceae bacterium]